MDLVWKEPFTDGGSPITGYIIEKKDKYTSLWEKALETNTPKPQALITGLIEGNEYQFRVIAINKAGQSEPGECSKTFLAKPRFCTSIYTFNFPIYQSIGNFIRLLLLYPFLVAPKIDRRNLRDITLSAGSTLKFDANITGEPPPHVDWRCGAIPLVNNKTVLIDNPPYQTKLIIRPVARGDSGEYLVLATNTSGKDSVTVNVIVTDKPTAPEGPIQISDVHKEGCKLKWKRPLDDGGTPIEYYQVDKLDPDTGCWVPAGRSPDPSKP